jgi:hypothetical protein
MAKPVKHYGQWRIRWTAENGKRQSETHDDYRAAAHKLREHEVHAEEIRRGVRQANPLEKTFDALADYWLDKGAPLAPRARTRGRPRGVPRATRLCALPVGAWPASIRPATQTIVAPAASPKREARPIARPGCAPSEVTTARRNIRRPVHIIAPSRWA